MGKNILELKSEIARVVDGVLIELREFLNDYNQNHTDTSLPDLKTIQEMKVFYDLYNNLLFNQDKVINLVVKADLVLDQLEEVRMVKLSRDLSNDYRELRDFKTWVESKINQLKSLRFTLFEVRRVISDKIKLLQGLLYKNFSVEL